MTKRVEPIGQAAANGAHVAARVLQQRDVAMAESRELREFNDREPDGVVRLCVPAQAARLRLIRLVAADLAGQLDFDLEAISELLMAVDEVCAQLVGLAIENASLHCEFRISPGEIDLTASTATDRDAVLRESSFGWRVLAEFTDWVESRYDEGARPATATGAAERWIGVRLCKRDRRITA